MSQIINVRGRVRENSPQSPTQSQPQWWWMTAQIFYVHPYISNKIPCFHFFPWRFHKIPVGWANTPMINKFVCQNWLNKEQFFYFVIFLFLLLSLHFPHVSRKVLCTSVTWSFLCSRRIYLMYWGIKCPRVWQFHFSSSSVWPKKFLNSSWTSWFVSKSFAANGFCTSQIVIFIEYHYRSLNTIEKFWTLSSDVSQWEVVLWQKKDGKIPVCDHRGPH